MNPDTIRYYGSIVMSVLICVIFITEVFLSYWKGDIPMQQLLVGVTAGAFSTAVGFWIGSSSGSAQKDRQLQQQQLPRQTLP